MGTAGSDGADLVVVPRVPGSLLSLGAGRSRDDLDELIDELFPDVDDVPGWTDALLVAAGVALLAWRFVLDGPALVLVGGLIAVGLGCVLPLRSAWRWRRRRALLSRGEPLVTSSPATMALVAAYQALLATTAPPDLAVPAVAAAHAAVLDVATLLRGATPTTRPELAYVRERTEAIEALTAALAVVPDDPEPAVSPSLVLEARQELDDLTDGGPLAHLKNLTDDATRRHDPH